MFSRCYSLTFGEEIDSQSPNKGYSSDLLANG
jgi:hypothetical protein